MRFLVVIPTHRAELAKDTIIAVEKSFTYPTQFEVLDGTPSKVHALNKALSEFLDPKKHDLYCTIDDDLILSYRWQDQVIKAFNYIRHLGVCGIDYTGTKEGESFMHAEILPPPRRFKDITFTETTNVINVGGPLLVMRATLAKRIGPYPFVNDGRRYHVDEDGWRCREAVRRKYRTGYVTNPNGILQFVSYQDTDEYLARKAADIKQWVENPKWK